VKSGDHDDRCVGKIILELRKPFESAAPGHADIEDD
jgi:hypothetical protein